MPLPKRSALGRHWALDEGVVFLNHGSFGACPRRVIARQRELQDRMEMEPIRFLVDELEPLLDGSRAELARLLGARAEDVAFTTNVTESVNAVLRSLEFGPGDELLTTDHEYNACRNALDFVAGRSGARVVVAELPLPVKSDDEIVAAVLARVTARTKIAMISWVTSPTAIVLPVGRLVKELQSRGVDVLLDAAHAGGMVDVDLDALGAAYTGGNCHKWMCSPKGAGFLHVRRDRQELIRPLVISHGANSTRGDRSRFLMEFDWTGTRDWTPWVCVGDALREVGSMVEGGAGGAGGVGGWAEVMKRNHELAVRGRAAIMRTLREAGIESEASAPDSMTGSIAAFTIPAAREEYPHGNFDPLKKFLEKEHSIQVPIVIRPSAPKRMVRIAAHLYNSPAEYEHLGRALVAGLRAGVS